MDFESISLTARTRCLVQDRLVQDIGLYDPTSQRSRVIVQVDRSGPLICRRCVAPRKSFGFVWRLKEESAPKALNMENKRPEILKSVVFGSLANVKGKKRPERPFSALKNEKMSRNSQKRCFLVPFAKMK